MVDSWRMKSGIFQVRGAFSDFFRNLFPAPEERTPEEGPNEPDEGDIPIPFIPEDPTEATPETPTETTTEVTAAVTEEGKVQTGDSGDIPGDLIDIVGVDGCDHGWYPEATIGLSVLSLVLIGLVILQTIRLRKRKNGAKPAVSGKTGKAQKSGKKTIKSISSTEQLGEQKPAQKLADRPAPAAAPIEAPAQMVQVGKLHAIGDRESQQDCLAVSPVELYPTKGLLAVVADGMGGLSDGDRVSQTVASAMMGGFMNSREVGADLILALTAEANQAVNRLLGPQSQGRSGSTLVGGIVKDGLFHYVSVGDSRICLYRQGALTQLNREHVYRNELVVQAINGVGTLWDAGTHPKAAGLTSFLGMGNLKYVDVSAEPVKLRGGDKIILMSDGVYNALTLLELESALMKPAQQAAEAMGQMIHTKAYRHQDNYTAVILEF